MREAGWPESSLLGVLSNGWTDPPMPSLVSLPAISAQVEMPPPDDPSIEVTPLVSISLPPGHGRRMGDLHGQL